MKVSPLSQRVGGEALSKWQMELWKRNVSLITTSDALWFCFTWGLKFHGGALNEYYQYSLSIVACSTIYDIDCVCAVSLAALVAHSILTSLY